MLIYLTTLSLLLTPISEDAVVESAAHQPYLHYESALNRPLLLCEDKDLLVAVNPADHRVEFYGLDDEGGAPRFLTQVLTGLDPVSLAIGDVNPSHLWVVNHGSDSLTVVDLDTYKVIDVVCVGDEPRDVLVAKGRVFVSCARARAKHSETAPGDWVENVVQVFDETSHEWLHQVPVEVQTPRSLATDGRYVYVAPLHAGNEMSVIAERDFGRVVFRGTAGAVVSINDALRSPRLQERAGRGWAPPEASLVLSAVDAGHPAPADRDIRAIDLETLELQEESTVGLATSIFALEYFQDKLWVGAIDGGNLFRFESVVPNSGFTNFVASIEAAPGGFLQEKWDTTNFENLDRFALPVAVAGCGDFVFVACLASSSVLVYASDGELVHTLSTAELPHGLQVDPENRRLYVYCRKGPSLLSYTWDESPVELRETSQTSLSYDPEPDIIDRGRTHLYSARPSTGHGNGSVACASCHLFGDQDMMPWDLGDPGGGISPYYADLIPSEAGSRLPLTHPDQDQVHPMKGGLMTQSLRGLDPKRPLHRRGDRRFLHSFRGAFRGLQGGDGVSDTSMQEMSTFLHTMHTLPNPFASRPFASREGGETPADLFQSVAMKDSERSCVDCHLPESDRLSPAFASYQLTDLGGSQMFLAPPLRGLYARMSTYEHLGMGFRHDGTIASLGDYVEQDSEHPALEEGTSDEILKAIQALDSGTSSWVGAHQVWHADNQDEVETFLESVRQAWGRSESFALIFKGFAEQPFGAIYAFDPALGGFAFLDDSGEVYRFDEVQQKVADRQWHGHFLGVPRGLQVRLGLDRDEDGLFDGKERAAGTDPHHPDSDRDGYTDGDEVMRWFSDPLAHQGILSQDQQAPQVQRVMVHSVFAHMMTLEVVTDEPCFLDVSASESEPAPSLASGEGLRRRHWVIVQDLSPGTDYDLQIRLQDRNGHQSVKSVPPFRTKPMAVHIEEMKMGRHESGWMSKVRILDQSGNPVVGLEVEGLFHFQARRDRGVADRLDKVFRVRSDQDGWASFDYGLDDPTTQARVTFTVISVGSLDPNDRYFVGYPGDEPLFFYEQPLNRMNFVTSDSDSNR